MNLRLLSIPFSHYVEKARWALDLTGLPYIEEKHLPIFHYVHHRRYGAGSTVPALVYDNTVLSDSADILMFAYRHGVPLYPRARLAEVQAWETRFNETLGPQVRVWAYSHILLHPELLPELITSCPKHEQRLAQPLLGQFGKLLGIKYGVRPGKDARALREIDAIWAQTDHLLADGRPYLVGSAFSAADLTLSALAGPMVLPPEYGFTYPPLEKLPVAMREQIETRRQTPTGRHIRAIYKKHRGHRPARQQEQSDSTVVSA